MLFTFYFERNCFGRIVRKSVSYMGNCYANAEAKLKREFGKVDVYDFKIN